MSNTKDTTEYTPSTEEVKALLDRGLRNIWHPVLPSWAVRDVPIGITRLGDNLVLWRGSDNKVHALEDRCPHRGAKLSLGRNFDNRVSCCYHGVEVNGAGVVENVPAVNGCPMEGKKCVRSYPVAEAAGAIFVYFGDEAHPEPPELELPEQLVGEEYGQFLCVAYWDCNYQYAIDNVIDPGHGAFLHAVSHSMHSGDKRADMKMSKIDQGIRIEKTNQQGENFDWSEFQKNSGTMWLRLSIPYQKKYTGGEFEIVGFATPIKDDHMVVFFWRCKKVQGWERDLWRFMYKNRLEGSHWAVLEQDRVVLENLAPEPREQEFLYQHDVAVTRLRRILEKEAKKQLKMLHAWREEHGHDVVDELQDHG